MVSVLLLSLDSSYLVSIQCKNDYLMQSKNPSDKVLLGFHLDTRSLKGNPHTASCLEANTVDSHRCSDFDRQYNFVHHCMAYILTDHALYKNHLDILWGRIQLMGTYNHLDIEYSLFDLLGNTRL